MDPFTLAAIGGTIYSGIKGAQAQKKGDQLQAKALEQSEYDYNLRAPLRRQGMQALGQVEGAYDMGNIGFNSANPFSAARGPARSTATIGNWDRMTTAPDVMDNAILGVTDDDLAWAQDATTRKRDDGSWAYKASERNHAQKQILDKANQRAGLSGIQPLLGQRLGAMQDRNATTGGFTAGGVVPAPRNAQRRGLMPLGGR